MTYLLIYVKLPTFFVFRNNYTHGSFLHPIKERAKFDSHFIGFEQIVTNHVSCIALVWRLNINNCHWYELLHPKPILDKSV